MSTTTAVRTVDGIELPASGVWKVDPGHAEIGFVGRHLMLTKVRGRFTGVDATVTIGDNPNDTNIEAVIDMASVESGDTARDDHLKSPDFFDVQEWSRATFRSTDVDWAGTKGIMKGELTIKGIKNELTLDVEYLGYARDPWDNDRAVFSASGVINRDDWDLSWNMPLDTGGLLVSREITLDLQVELIRDVDAD
ncbi:MAG: polyisoprenoid-binding protein [Acidimicrobiia bacterium]|nr:polyisoprenoid-binding protein [Acidimicrobiia bacterium]